MIHSLKVFLCSTPCTKTDDLPCLYCTSLLVLRMCLIRTAQAPLVLKMYLARTASPHLY